MPEPSTTTQPLIGLQESLDLAKLMLHERLTSFAALALRKLARESLKAARDIGDVSLAKAVEELNLERGIVSAHEDAGYQPIQPARQKTRLAMPGKASTVEVRP